MNKPEVDDIFVIFGTLKTTENILRRESEKLIFTHYNFETKCNFSKAWGTSLTFSNFNSFLNSFSIILWENNHGFRILLFFSVKISFGIN